MAMNYIEYRKEICSRCEFLENREGAVGKVCGRCGCSLTFKIPILFSQCPERKWEPTEVFNSGV